jgi:hypothetical protein
VPPPRRRLSDDEFERVFGRSKAAWAGVPAFKKPIIKKKHGL